MKFWICKKCGFKNEIDQSYCPNCLEDRPKRSFNKTPEQVNKITGDRNPAYRNGMYQRSATRTFIGQKKYFRNRNELKAKMILEHGYLFCEHCLTNKSMFWETHHIIYRSEKPNHPNLHDKENLLHLCMVCHNQFHKNKGIRNQIVIDRGLDKIFGQDILDKNMDCSREKGWTKTRLN